ncbi:MAG: hypothetical protein ABIQ88_19665 [Chitinophagaceae bacterium]
MKKIIITSVIAIMGVGFLEASNAGPVNLQGQPVISKTALDTIPNKRKDTSWNKKKYPDTTHMPKRDTTKLR